MLSHLGFLWRLNEICSLPKLNWISSASNESITVALLEFNCSKLCFKSKGVSQDFVSQVVELIRHLTGKAIDQGSDIGSILMQDSVADQVCNACRSYLINKNNLQHIPDKQRWVINATNVQSKTGGQFV